MRSLLLAGLAALAVLVSGCSHGDTGTTIAKAGACRLLTPDDVARPSDSTAQRSCGSRHTAQTFLVGRFPKSLRAGYSSDELGRYVYQTCQPAFVSWTVADESIAMRSMLSWAWFRPSAEAWRAGARWFRCDVVGAPTSALGPVTSYRPLPRTTKGLLGGTPPDDWMACARGETTGPKVPCSQAHDWRAVTTVKIGQPGEAYPGDRVVQVRSSQFCSDSVGAWLGYPTTDYDYGVTVFHEAEWTAGNRRSICWVRTTS